MLKAVLFLLGGAAGATGVTSWLLSDPEAPGVAPGPPGPQFVQERWLSLQDRVREAIAEGREAGTATEARLRQELDVYRRGQRPSNS